MKPGKKQLTLTDDDAQREFSARIKDWHSEFNAMGENPEGSASSNWHSKTQSSDLKAFDELFQSPDFVSSVECIKKLQEVMKKHPSSQTEEVDETLDDHVYSMF